MHTPIIATPGKPKQSNREKNCSDHHGKETLFRNGDVIVGFEFAVVARFKGDYDSAADEDAEDETDVGERGEGLGDSAFFGEDYGVCFKKQV